MLSEMITKTAAERDQVARALDQREEELAYCKSQLAGMDAERVELLAARAELQYQLEEMKAQPQQSPDGDGEQPDARRVGVGWGRRSPQGACVPGGSGKLACARWVRGGR